MTKKQWIKLLLLGVPGALAFSAGIMGMIPFFPNPLGLTALAAALLIVGGFVLTCLAAWIGSKLGK